MRRVALLACLTLLAACGGTADGAVQRQGSGGDTKYVAGSGIITAIPPEERGEPVDFAGPLLGGEGQWRLADARGDVVVLNVWASWCAPCRKEAPALQAASERLAGKDVTFVGVNTKDTERLALDFVTEFGITYPSVYDELGEGLLAFRDDVPPAALPTTLVIDREGRVAVRALAELGESTVVGLAEDVLAER